MSEILEFVDKHPILSIYIFLNMMENAFSIVRMIIKSIGKKDKYHIFEDEDWVWKIKIK